jgi:uncharacterized protein (TIGR03000 family)
MSHRRLPVAVVLFFLALLGLRTLAHGQPATEPTSVSLRVLLPHPNAELIIEDQPTRQRGSERVFAAPPLEPDATYTYTVAATWRPNNYTVITRTRKVKFRPTPEVVVDLRQADDGTPDKIVVRYVPTPPEVVAAMLRLASVGKDDVVYDLGCGDGRIVIAAVSQFGAKHGVGIDLDPRRIKESKANAAKAGVGDRVDFRQGDVLQVADLADATVVTLYMGDELNLLLRPILQRTLKPGSRIVSHRFTMGDWKPVKTETLKDREGEDYLIHLWKIDTPAGK